MAVHMSLRLAWHSDGWNGHICKRPCENVYCVGQHSYPGEMIAEQRDLDFETAHAGEPYAAHPFWKGGSSGSGRAAVLVGEGRCGCDSFDFASLHCLYMVL